jgi:hypothetical protein
LEQPEIDLARIDMDAIAKYFAEMDTQQLEEARRKDQEMLVSRHREMNRTPHQGSDGAGVDQ